MVWNLLHHEGFPSLGVNSRIHQGSPQVTGKARQEDVTLQPNEDLLMRAYTSHLSVQLFLLSGRSTATCNREVMRERQRRFPKGKKKMAWNGAEIPFS
ncbi:hypothetical protein VZT92_011590 [Zoarces viviparus]|uniref:Uncharacterized protein n=1 Tax=Zoarces viviparus TaxID=48416 RepID=A0AAW1EBY9_ZOAVI